MFRMREQVQQRLVPATFDPLPDITAYEMAVIFQNMPFGNGGARNHVSFTPGEWDALGAGVRRHFKNV